MALLTAFAHSGHIASYAPEDELNCCLATTPTILSKLDFIIGMVTALTAPINLRKDSILFINAFT
ncbi:MAG TPA: hypothetical protein DEV85_11225 [Vibrio sp.]|nr:hypothetical protein [Vibrio sp.]